ncbi:MAG TPA: prolipoprotein diacylglyceryl transferase family protein [Polyangiaceae bacterium]|nr:prolipoprotein diacylglyceryl transferase family protein [Polyangiaceae bacterium]
MASGLAVGVPSGVLPFVFAPDGVVFGLSPWAFAVFLGGWVGLQLAERLARVRGLDLRLFHAAVFWVVAAGLVLGHVLDEGFYHPELLVHPSSLLLLNQGQSSCGGFAGAVAGGLLWKYVDVRRNGFLPTFARRPRPLALLPFAEIMMATFPVTWVFARLGCALVHDHPGRLAAAGSWLALAWPTGTDDGVVHALGPLRYVYGSTSRYDLGLVECLLTIPLAVGLALTWRRPRPLGFYTAVVCLTYAPVRFALDYLRATDVPEADRRYASLTFAQWFCVALFAAGIAALARLRSGAAASRDPLGAGDPSS